MAATATTAMTVVLRCQTAVIDFQIGIALSIDFHSVFFGSKLMSLDQWLCRRRRRNARGRLLRLILYA